MSSYSLCSAGAQPLFKQVCTINKSSWVTKCGFSVQGLTNLTYLMALWRKLFQLQFVCIHVDDITRGTRILPIRWQLLKTLWEGSFDMFGVCIWVNLNVHHGVLKFGFLADTEANDDAEAKTVTITLITITTLGITGRTGLILSHFWCLMHGEVLRETFSETWKWSRKCFNIFTQNYCLLQSCWKWVNAVEEIKQKSKKKNLSGVTSCDIHTVTIMRHVMVPYQNVLILDRADLFSLIE